MLFVDTQIVFIQKQRSMDSMMETYLAAAKRVAKLVGDMVERAFHVTNKTTETKENFGDLVTQTDKEVEKFVFSELRKEFPGHHFIGEESVAAGNGGEGCWGRGE